MTKPSTWPKIKITRTCGARIEVREYRYESGFVEISLLRPEVLPGSGPILSAVVSRQPGVKNWHAYTNGSLPAYSGPVKSRAVDCAANYADALRLADLRIAADEVTS